MKREIEKIKKIILSINNMSQITPCLNIISSFHERHLNKGHDESNYLYGYLDATIYTKFCKTKKELI